MRSPLVTASDSEQGCSGVGLLVAANRTSVIGKNERYRRPVPPRAHQIGTMTAAADASRIRE